jgi:hypothetical protein
VAPSPAPAPRIVATDVAVGGEVLSPSVTFTLDMRPGRWTDPFLELLSNDIRNAPAGTPNAALRDLNPWLADSLLARARAPVSRILVYKSCNPAATVPVYTTSNNPSVCTRGVIRDSLGVERGPAAYRQITPPVASDPSSLGNVTTFTDANVATGQSYLYAFVPETRGARFPVSIRLPNGSVVIRDSVFAAPTAVVPTSRAVPNVAVVYIPASRQAGARGAQVHYLSEAGGSSIAHEIIPAQGGQSVTNVYTWGGATAIVSDTVRGDQSYRLVFGDTIVVRDYGPVGSPIIDSTVVQVVRGVTTGFTYAGAVTTRTATPIRVRADVISFRLPTPGGLPVHTVAPIGASTEVIGNTRVDTRRIAGPAAGVLLEGAADRPLFVSNVAVANQPFTPPAFLGSPAYTGTRITVLNRVTSPATFILQFYLDRDSVRMNPVVGIPFSSVWITGGANASRAIGTSGGEYQVRFSGFEYGPGSPFRSDLGIQGMSNALAASLQARVVGSRTDVSQPTVEAVNRSLGLSISAADLADVTLPFTVRNVSHDRSVTVAMLRTDKAATALWGTGIDTFRVAVPQEHWIPGERLIFLEDVEIGTVSGTTVTRRSERQVAVYPATIGCGTTAAVWHCNPIAGRGQLSYNPVAPGYALTVRYALPFNSDRELRFDVTGSESGAAVQRVSQASMDSINVVPNPYIVYSRFEQQPGGQARIMFTHMPPSGTLRVYTVSGLLVQEVRWVPEDLHGMGDLFFNLRTREGTEMASGLYLFTVSAEDPETRAERKKLGRFIIIR